MNHSHILYDSDPHFKIDPISRKITNESSTKTTLIQHDHNSERFTFEVPRYVEGHDLSLCNVVEIHYLNIEANTKNVKAGVYSVDDLQVKTDDENTVVCSWLVPLNATQLVGQLQFLVRFSCVNENTGKIEYVWNTAPYTNISVSSGIYNSESSSDNPVPPFNFVTTINGDILKFFVGTQAQYNALSADDTDGLFAIITDDKTKEEIFAAIEEMQTEIDEFKSGNRAVPKATHATTADKATTADNATNASLLKCNSPTISKKITEEGFYYIEFGSPYQTFRYSCGVVHFSALRAVTVKSFINTFSADSLSFLTLRISTDGNIKIDSNFAGATVDATEDYNVYIKKIGE